jgi:hypothetical protein
MLAEPVEAESVEANIARSKSIHPGEAYLKLFLPPVFKICPDPSIYLKFAAVS